RTRRRGCRAWPRGGPGCVARRLLFGALTLGDELLALLLHRGDARVERRRIPAARPGLRREQLIAIPGDEARERHALVPADLVEQPLHGGAEGLLLVDEVALLLELALLLADGGVGVLQLQEIPDEGGDRGGEQQAEERHRDDEADRTAARRGSGDGGVAHGDPGGKRGPARGNA